MVIALAMTQFRFYFHIIHQQLKKQLMPCISPVPTHPNNQNFTRVGIVAAYSSSDSNSNQSPPSALSAKIEKGVQTTENFDLTEAGKQDEKKAKEIEGLLRANTDLKQSLEVHKGKVRASKETIKRLLVEQSRMERKQVFIIKIICKF